MYVYCVYRRESTERECGVTNEREETDTDNSMSFSQTKVTTIRTSRPSGRQKKREGDRALKGKSYARARCESNFHAVTNAPLECQHPTKVRHETRTDGVNRVNIARASAIGVT